MRSPDPEANFADRVKVVVHALTAHHVDCVIIGGVAVAAHGSAYLTRDFDIAYFHDRDNIRRIVAALAPLHPLLRVPGSDEGVPFPFDEHTLYNGGNFTLKTDVGDVDILAHVGGFFNYAEIKSMSQTLELYEREMLVLSVEGLIRAKKAANRIKDQLVLPELEVLLEAEKRQREQS